MYIHHPAPVVHLRERILVVVAFPGHESDQRVLTKADLALMSGRTVSHDLALLYLLSLVHDGLLVVAVALVASLELGQLVIVTFTVLQLERNDLGSEPLNHTACFCNTHTPESTAALASIPVPTIALSVSISGTA